MRNLICLVLAGSLSLASVAVAAQESEHDHQQHAADADAELDLNRPEPGKWASDKPLRRGMSELQAAFETHRDALEKGKLDAEAAAGLADDIEEQVDFMFANCSLPAAADAELHKLLVAALGSARMLRESDSSLDGLHQLQRVLHVYSEYFDHPGWSG